ncbi:peptide chain release factor N(5)-glutamine methyltransferase [Tenacibaculum sp.]|nr:peptide chain release factor N(5)-glutamine methyltransferase [Tenacibaculum sp.]
MTLKEFKTNFTEQLSSIFPINEIDTFFFYLIEEYLNFQRIDLVLRSDFEIPKTKTILFENAIKRLQKQEPIQYILGKTEFYGFPFLVNENTLIPRPETEELVEWVLSETKALINPSIMDIGTGSGCIPISIKKKSQNATVYAVDISEEALKVAKQNASLNEVTIQFILADILKTTNILNLISNKKNKQNSTKLDIIVSNPPYVRELEKVEIKKNVLENEPHLALFVEDDNPLIFYNKIADLAKGNLHKNGLLFFEINQYLAKETVDMLQQKGFKNIELRKDFVGNDRMVKANI